MVGSGVQCREHMQRPVVEAAIVASREGLEENPPQFSLSKTEIAPQHQDIYRKPKICKLSFF
jgi:hypothetical protein